MHPQKECSLSWQYCITSKEHDPWLPSFQVKMKCCLWQINFLLVWLRDQPSLSSYPNQLIKPILSSPNHRPAQYEYFFLLKKREKESTLCQGTVHLDTD